jgi:Tol biopolymer transport system component
LAGRLWVDQALGDIWRIELASGQVSRVNTPSDIFPTQPSLTRDGKQMVLQGAPKTREGVPSQRFGIYIDGALALPAQGNFSYEDATWSADGKQIFFTRIGAESSEPKPTDSFLAIQVADASNVLSARTLITNAFQPAPSPTGEWLAYVAVDTRNPMSLTRSIRVRNLNSGEDRMLIKPDQFVDVYGPRWLNNSQLIFSAADASSIAQDTNKVPMRMIDALLGVHVAAAHSWAGNVWRVNADGTGLVQLNRHKLQAPIAAPSPDGGKHTAVLAYEGVFVMDADGGNWTQISNDGGNGGIVWTQ